MTLELKQKVTAAHEEFCRTCDYNEGGHCGWADEHPDYSEPFCPYMMEVAAEAWLQEANRVRRAEADRVRRGNEEEEKRVCVVFIDPPELPKEEKRVRVVVVHPKEEEKTVWVVRKAPEGSDDT